jgi:DNA invertase Pin-like site-specific DNA recombinase
MDLSKDLNALNMRPGNSKITLGKPDVYVVKYVLNKRQEPNGSYSYQIVWESDNSISWEPEENINPNVIAKYEMMNEFIKYNSSLKNCNTKIFGYCRTSKGRDDNISIAVQKQLIVDICKANNYAIDFIVTENGKSARDMSNLTELNFLIDYIKFTNTAGLQKVLMIYDVSRFSRNTSQALAIIDDLKQNGIEVRFIKENLSSFNGDYQITLYLAASQQLSDTTSMKVKASIEYNRARGFHVGGRPKFGYKVVNKVLTLDQEELAIIKKVHDLHLQRLGLFPNKKQLFLDIISKLNNDNIHMRGKYFNPRKVQDCLNLYENIYN